LFRRFTAVCFAFIVGLFSAGNLRADLKPRVIVFVHGIHGDRETWRAPNGAYWPQMIQTDPHFHLSDVVVAEYPTPATRGQYSTEKLAQILFDGLKKKGVWEHREVVFVAHSLGGLLTEEMLLNHPVEAARVQFIVSYSTPHQGSFVASLARIYDSDPLLTDLRDSNDNSFLMDLEQHWRSTAAVSRIHRFCAYETRDTAAGEGVGRYLHAHTRVVSYYSATYGCDVDTPAQKIDADHIAIVRPADRNADAYTFLAKVYHSHPVMDTVERVRDNMVQGLRVDCNRTNEASDLQVPMELDASRHEQLISAEAEFVNTDKIKEIKGPQVTRVDANGIAHVAYAFKGKGRGILGCPEGDAALLVHFHLRGEVTVNE